MDLVGGLNLLVVILGFGFLILVHELGHYLAARWAGIRVDNFAIGMGPVLCSWRHGLGVQLGSSQPELCRRFNAATTAMIPEAALREAGLGETEWTLRLLPLGGFVRMLGQDDAAPSGTLTAQGDPRSYRSAPVGKRMVVISGGVVMNIILGVLFFMIAFLAGVKAEAPVVGGVVPGSPAARAGIMPGDHIKSINGAPTATFQDVIIVSAMHVGTQPLHITVDRGGERLALQAVPEYEAAVGMQRLGLAPAEGLSLAADRQSIPLLHQALVSAGFFNPARVTGAPTGWFECAGDREAFVRQWGGATLRTIDGRDATSAASLRVAAKAGKGALMATTWDLSWARDATTISVSLEPIADLEPILYAPGSSAGAADLELGVAGLVPLVMVRDVLPGSANAAILKAGDVIVAAGDESGPRMDEFRALLAKRAGSTVPLVVLRDGQRVPVEARVDGSGRLEVMIGYAMGLPMIAGPIESAQVGDTVLPTPAAGLGLVPCSTIVSIGGEAVRDWTSIRGAIQRALAAGARSVPITTRMPGGGDAIVNAELRFNDAQAKTIEALAWSSPIGPEWFEPLMVTISANGNPLQAVAMGFRETRKLAIMTWLTIDRLARGTVAVKQLRGPVGIVQIGTQVADRGWTYLIFFLAVISVNLAVLNFLPLPIADGGHMCYLIYERITGREPSVLFQNIAFLAGLLVFGALFVVTFFNDVTRLVTG
jgi:regulator of sigma E protease